MSDGIKIFMGVGADYSPDTNLLDALITKRLQERGFTGSRDMDHCLYGSLSKGQAIRYARNESEEYLRLLIPEEGAVVTYAVGISDLILDFDGFCRELYWSGLTAGQAWAEVLQDSMGHVETLETYLGLDAEIPGITAMVDHYLEGIEIRDIVLGQDDSLASFLEGHDGEIWITGPCKILEAGIEPVAGPDFP